ncbi:DNA polymerase III subunit delta [Inmirania thermothiophila]|uniref:DNA polymerase III subunit delta n=1 Tax=Inmirania thermothiophila TaxID=1750597 RepID=A0A3N1Y7R9_9GAMM|nr:DNA polymerase III subunit delta [Inmirania thermothiophila]ROR34864.1 DNA polymerase III delta subunit [Inmirania thermothiophila]
MAQIDAERIEEDLARGLRPAYLVHGDEPLGRLEAADAVRRAARAAGCEGREVIEADGAFDGAALAEAAASPGLFAARRLVELRLAAATLKAGARRVLEGWLAAPPPDAVLLVQAERLERRELGQAWVAAMARVGAVVQARTPARRELPGWVAARLRARGVEADAEAAARLAERVEGNLLAAAQEIERLALLHAGGRLGVEAVEGSVADSARFDVFALGEAVLAGDPARALRVLRRLREEGSEPTLVLWALAREVRLAAAIAYDVESGAAPAEALRRHGVWRSRERLVAGAARRRPAAWWRARLRECAEADRVIKGFAAGRPWQVLEAVAARAAGAALPG